MKISPNLYGRMDGSKGETELVLCRGIWYGNLQFWPEWLSKGLKNQKFYARSNTGLRLIPSGLKIRFVHEKPVFLGFFTLTQGRRKV